MSIIVILRLGTTHYNRSTIHAFIQKMLQLWPGADDFVSDMKYRVDIKLAPQKRTFEDDRLNQMGDRQYATRQILV